MSFLHQFNPTTWIEEIPHLDTFLTAGLVLFVGTFVFVWPVLLKHLSSKSSHGLPPLTVSSYPWWNWSTSQSIPDFLSVLGLQAKFKGGILATSVPSIGPVFVVSGEDGMGWFHTNPALSSLRGNQAVGYGLVSNLAHSPSLLTEPKLISLLSKLGTSGGGSPSGKEKLKELASLMDSYLLSNMSKWGSRASLEDLTGTLQRLVTSSNVAVWIQGLNASTHQILVTSFITSQTHVASSERIRHFNLFKSTLEGIVKVRMESKEPTTRRDLLDLWILENTNSKGIQSVNGLRLVKGIEILLTAAQDTTYVTLSNLLVFLSSSTATYSQIQSQVDSSLQLNGSSILKTVLTPNSLPLLDAAILETLRITDQTFAIRQVTESTKFGKFHIPAKSLVVLSHPSLHLNPDKWLYPQIFNLNRHPLSLDLSPSSNSSTSPSPSSNPNSSLPIPLPPSLPSSTLISGVSGNLKSNSPSKTSSPVKSSTKSSSSQPSPTSNSPIKSVTLLPLVTPSTLSSPSGLVIRGAGKHACPGTSHSNLQMKLILTRLIQGWDFGFHEGKEISNSNPSNSIESLTWITTGPYKRREKPLEMWYKARSPVSS